MSRLYDEKTMIQYLLGKLPEEKKKQFEQQYFTDDEVFDLLQAVEDDLIERYVMGRLSKKEKELFEASYLQNPKRKEKVQFARSLSRAHAEILAPTHKRFFDSVIVWAKSVVNFFVNMNRPLQIAFGSLLILAVLGIWSFIELINTKTDFRNAKSEQSIFIQKEKDFQDQIAAEETKRNELLTQLESERKLREEVKQQLEIEKKRRIPVLSFVLSPGRLRNVGEIQKILLQSGSYKFLLQLDIESEKSYRSYRVVIRNKENVILWSKDGLSQEEVNGGKIVTAILESQIMRPGNYQLTLFGRNEKKVLEMTAEYYFAVIKTK